MRRDGLGSAVLILLVCLVLGRPWEGVSLPWGDGGGDGASEATAYVLRAVDGDTIEVRLHGRDEYVRYIGVDTPETVKPDTPVQCFGPEASRHTKDLLPPGTGVLLQRDEEPRDRYGRLLAYLWRARDHRFVNRDLVAEGFARTLSIEPGHFERIVPGSNGVFRPTVVVDGRVVGTWSRKLRKASVAIDVELFGRSTKALRTAVGRAATHHGAFHQLDAVVTVG